MNGPEYTPPPFKLPRLLLLDAKPSVAANISLALGSYCLPFGFAEIYRDAVRGLLGEQGELALRPTDDEFIQLGTKTYLRRNLEANARDAIETDYGGPYATAMLLYHRIRNELPYFACLTIEDATFANQMAAAELCGHLFHIHALEPKDVYWLTIADDIGAHSSAPLGIRCSALSPSQLTSKAEILSAMEKLP